MEKKLADLGIATVGDLRGFAAEELRLRFGSFGRRLHLRARGIDERPVQPNQPVQSISAEDTFERDLTLYEFDDAHRRLAENAWLATRKTPRLGRTVAPTPKTRPFRLLPRTLPPALPPPAPAEPTANPHS